MAHVDWHPDTGLTPRPEMPYEVMGRLPIWIGEATYNLRAALDYLVYVLACQANGWRHVLGTQFPICDSKAEFIRRTPSWLTCVPAQAVERIEEVQPFAGCEWTRLLRDLSNPDKHRSMTGLTSNARVVRGDDPAIAYALRPEDRSPDRYYFVCQVVVKDTNQDVVDTLKLVHREVLALIREFKPTLEQPPA